MFDKFNIIFNHEVKKEEKTKFSLIDLFPNTKELAVITFLIYFLGVLYQILKLIGAFTTNPKLGNLMFFSFSNSINDFLIIFGVSFVLFFLTFLITFLINVILHSFNFSKNKFRAFLLFVLSYELILGIYQFSGGDLFNKKYVIIILSIGYIISIVLSGLIIYKKITKVILYIFIGLYILYGFFIMLYSGVKYYGCENIRDNYAEKDCFLLEYKNDKYGFTGKGDIYKLDEFKSFFTSDYFKNQTSSGNTN
ncbi:MAG: hypothetical protein PHV23_04250 [Candidatus Gracilibacteria bacterium]|nr:hypothetical protein [Candidatus Gracilibacteria bacterium]